MDAFLAFLAGALIAGSSIALVTFITVNNGWKNDCERIGYHLEGSAEQKVYECKLKR